MANLRCSAAEESEDTLNAFTSTTLMAGLGGTLAIPASLERRSS